VLNIYIQTENSPTLLLYPLSAWGRGKRRQHLPLLAAQGTKGDGVLNSHHHELFRGKNLFWYSVLS